MYKGCKYSGSRMQMWVHYHINDGKNQEAVSNILFITVLGHKEGHIEP